MYNYYAVREYDGFAKGFDSFSDAGEYANDQNQDADEGYTFSVYSRWEYRLMF